MFRFDYHATQEAILFAANEPKKRCALNTMGCLLTVSTSFYLLICWCQTAIFAAEVMQNRRESTVVMTSIRTLAYDASCYLGQGTKANGSSISKLKKHDTCPKDPLHTQLHTQGLNISLYHTKLIMHHFSKATAAQKPCSLDAGCCNWCTLDVCITLCVRDQAELSDGEYLCLLRACTLDEQPQQSIGLVWASLAGCEGYLAVSLDVRDVFEEGNDNRED